MDITHISSSRIPSRAANSIQVMRMCQAFALNGHNVTLLAVQPAQNGQAIDDYSFYGVAKCFELLKCPHWKLSVVGSALHALCALAAVAARPLPGLFYGRYAYNLAAISWLGVPMILEVHDVPPNRKVEITLRHLFQRAHFVRLVAISGALAGEYRRIFPGLARDKIMVAHDGAPVPSVSSDAALPAWPTRPGVLQVGYTGHLYPGRGIEVIIPLATALPGVDFHIVGGTDEGIEKWKQACPPDNVIFHGYVAPGEVGQHRAHLDVLLAPYQERVAVAGGGGDTARWMSPLKIFEYMASGKAIVCSDLPVLREVLTDGVNALLVPPADLQAWVEALSLLRDNPELRTSLGIAAKKDFTAHYTWQKRAAAVVSNLP